MFLIISHFLSFFLSFSIIFSHRAYYGYYAYFFRIFKNKNKNMEVEGTGEAKDLLSDLLSDKRLPSRPAPFLEGVQVCRCAGVRKCLCQGGLRSCVFESDPKILSDTFSRRFPRRLSRRCAGVQVCRRAKLKSEHHSRGRAKYGAALESIIGR